MCTRLSSEVGFDFVEEDEIEVRYEEWDADEAKVLTFPKVAQFDLKEHGGLLQQSPLEPALSRVGKLEEFRTIFVLYVTIE